MSKFNCLLAGFIPALASAQITIDQADLPQAGDEWGIYSDYEGGTAFAPTPGGSSAQTWNYANAFNITGTFGFTWAAPATVQGNVFFPGAGAGVDFVGISSFYSTTSTGLYNLGSYFGSPDFTATTHVANGLIMPVPFTYGGLRTFSEASTAITVFTTGSPAMKSVRRSGGTYQCDAWGTLHTPAYPGGTDVLRLAYTHDATVDSTFTDATGTGNGPWTFSQVEQFPGYLNYLFVQDAHPVVVAEVVDDGGQASYYTASIPEGITEENSRAKELLAFPVPTMDDLVHINLNGADATTLEIVDAIGRVKQRLNVRGVTMVNVVTQGWEAGAYHFRCSASDGAVVGLGRFVVAR